MKNKEERRQEYYNLLSILNKTQKDKNRIKKLSIEFSNEPLGDTPKEQELYKQLEKGTREIRKKGGFKIKGGIPPETIQEVKGMISKFNLDWL